MPTIEISLEDLKSLVGDKLPTTKDELDHLLHNVKGELEALEGDKLIIALGDSNRPELWSAEGLAKELKGFLGVERGCKEYFAEKQKDGDCCACRRVGQPYSGNKWRR